MGPAITRLICPCCDQLLSKKTIRAHKRGRGPLTLRAAVAASLQESTQGPKDYPNCSPSKTRRHVARMQAALDGSIGPGTQENRSSHQTGLVYQSSTCDLHGKENVIQSTVSDDAQSVNSIEALPFALFEPTSSDSVHAIDAPAHIPEASASVGRDLDFVESTARDVSARIWHGRTRRTTVEDAPDSDDEDEAPVVHHDDGFEDPMLENSAGSGIRDDSDSDEDEYEAISIWDQLAEGFLRAGMVSGEDLTEEDLECLRPFALKVETHMPGETFAKLPYAFPNANLKSWKAIQSRAAQLSGFEPERYDCCINSCVAFTGVYADEDHCPFCQAPRWNAQRRPRQQFIYLPIIPRLKAQMANREMAQRLQYRATEHVHENGVIRDVMDGTHYRELLNKKVNVNGRELRHYFFEDPRDMAFGLSTDGFAPFKRRTKTAWPLILINYNLPPEIRNLLSYILGLGVVPGPKKPVDFNSFLWPLTRELLRLAVGVHAYDILSDDFFALRAFLLLVFGDIPAISMVMRMKGHNGSCPCRMCAIRAIRIPDSRNPIHYVPLDRSRHPDVRDSPDPDVVRQYHPEQLPLRSHDQFLAQATEVQFASSVTDEERLAKAYGIKGVPLLSVLPSLSFPASFPYDFMHLIWENVVKNLMQLWTGAYKSLDTGTEDYEIDARIWDAIGEASAAAGDTLPYVFGPRPPNVASDRISWTADTRSFWAQYVGPVLLERRFKHQKYYDHFVLLVKLIRRCLQFELTQEEVEEIRDGFICWVQKYEQFYYQYNPQRLSACPLTIHALLHIADSIVKTGPVWAAWAFPMERYCGILQPAIRSRRFPYASINRHVVDRARLTQIKLMYGSSLQDHLTLKPPAVEKGKVIPGYGTCVLLPARRMSSLDRGTLDKIVGALCTPLWNDSPIGSPRSAATGRRRMGQGSEDKRDATFVRYEVLVDQNAHHRHRPIILEKKTLYGQLQRILHVQLRPIPSHALLSPPPIVIAAIQTCSIQRSNQDLDIHYYQRMGGVDYVDITTVQCVVGRIRDRSQFAIVDRSGALARAIFVTSNE
ncbi:hypothetical protein NUW54_g4465 [Trametes sanguinea]|uniref:Uncharacterized protein n=1 Tax=Trametes sanguinea TaxID=158606 RepID=A0ACC1PZ43_9APHY|nr:hypothetical protein NUW54_g4465 [Trametes sanguinea]